MQDVENIPVIGEDGRSLVVFRITPPDKRIPMADGSFALVPQLPRLALANGDACTPRDDEIEVVRTGERLRRV